VELNQPAPDFILPDLQGRVHRLSDARGRIAVINFWSAECPHSERADRSITSSLLRWGQAVVLLSIACNRNEPAGILLEAARNRGLPAVLVDAQHHVADLYAAQITPQAFVVDRDGILRYRGAVDDVNFRQRVPTRFLLGEAVQALLEGRLPAVMETPPHGCAIVREL
jgi:peroxiredoxin